MKIKITKVNNHRLILLLNDYKFIDGNKIIFLYGETIPKFVPNAYMLRVVNDKKFCEEINYFLEVRNVDSLFLYLDRKLTEVDEIILTLLKSKLSKLFIYVKED